MATASTSRMQGTPGIIPMNMASTKGSKGSSSPRPNHAQPPRPHQPRKEHQQRHSAFVDEAPTLLPQSLSGTGDRSEDSSTPTRKRRTRPQKRVREQQQQQSQPQRSEQRDIGPAMDITTDEEDIVMSRSAPATTYTDEAHRGGHHHQQHHHSSAEEWEMPASNASHADGSGLTWQQQLLRQQQQGKQSRPKRSDSKRKNQQQQQHQSIPSSQSQPISIEQLEPAPAPSALTWQQEQLRKQSDNSKSPVKSTKKQARRDEETFGSAPSQQQHQDNGKSKPRAIPTNKNKASRQANAGQQSVDAGEATPTKIESRYAGPTFHNSPAPSSLPTPSFLLRRQAMDV